MANNLLMPTRDQMLKEYMAFWEDISDINLARQLGRLKAEDAMEKVGGALQVHEERNRNLWQPYWKSVEEEE